MNFPERGNKSSVQVQAQKKAPARIIDNAGIGKSDEKKGR
jgi:hypothetical protein